ncbi:unnamed protein product [Adineta steineri]|uniref:PH domain-containing protein n=1 Tax=Adineta steineri TaxID=433720 RepID=A0A814TD78_9BILA|nr:unnamed protein product [Adineta steineri]
MATQRARDAARHLKNDIKSSMHKSSRSKDRSTHTTSSAITSDTNNDHTVSNSALHAPSAGYKRSNSAHSAIATLTSLPTAPRVTTDNPNSIRGQYSNPPNLSPLKNAPVSSMQNLTNTANVNSIGTGIVQPTALSQRPLHMQSTTPSAANGKDEMRGWLYKWTNYLKGYQKRWFVLQAGILSYYRSQHEMTHTCRGTVYLESAHLSSNDTCHFVISNGSTVIHLRTSSENDKQRWMNALQSAKQKALKVRKQYQDSDEEVSTTDEVNDLQQQNLIQQQTNINDQNKLLINTNERAELATMNKAFDSKLDDLKMCMDLINRHYQALYRTLGDLEQLDKTEATVNIIKSVNERATLFRITSTAMLNACQELVQLIQNQGRKWQKAVQFERDARLRMERMCEQVALQSAKLEKQVQRASRSDKTSLLSGRSTLTTLKSSDLRGTNEASNLSDDEEFYDAIDDPQTIGVFRVPLQQHLSNNDKKEPNIVDDDVSSGNEDSGSEEQDENNLPMVIVKASKKEEVSNNAAITTDTSSLQSLQKPVNNNQQVAIPKRKRRDRIPERPNYSINLWSIMKNCVGKDLSKIPIPVNFSEPISMLQRITEELEYSSVLDMAAKSNDNWEQLAYVAAFTISSYSTTTTRVNKPFNPLLGETYECDRTDDLGWRSVAEQVSHHPPALSTYAEGPGWTLYQEFTMTSKFRGQYLSITPLGHSHLIFKNTGNHFTWRKVTTLVNNIIVGKLWIDNVGEMDIINHTTKDVCKLKYYPYSYFSKDVPRKVTGVVTDVNGQARWVLTGTWTEKIEGGPVESASGHHKHSHMETRNMKLLWQRKMPPAYLETMYNFTQLAIELNEFEPDVAPTDSRRRPDQRLMEEGRWDEANSEKLRLEEKQRQTRRAKESGGHDNYTSKWFKKQQDTLTDSEIHMFTNEYWECKQKQDWARCYDFGQQYSRIRIFEYESYSDVKFLKFNIQGPTTLANWSLTLSTEGKCTNYFANIHFYLQHGAYPLTAPRNESLPETYIPNRHNLFKLIFNTTLLNPLIQLNNPPIGTWFAMTFIDHPTSEIKPKITTGCNLYLSTWLDYQVVPSIFTLVFNEPRQVVLSDNKTSIYASYYTSVGNSRLRISFDWSNNCEIIFLARINALPNIYLYDYKSVCTNKTCLIEIDQLSASISIYFQLTVTNVSCLINPLHGEILIRSTECLPSSDNFCVQPYPTRRIMFNYYYDFLYVPIYTTNRFNSHSTSSITLNGNDVSMYAYEFIVDDRNIGGTLHFDFESRLMPFVSPDVNVSILGCLSKYQPRRFDQCESNYKILIDKNSISLRSLPYPEMAFWYLTLEFFCNGSKNECTNAAVSLMFQISSSQCTKQQCGTYGICRIMTSQQNVFSTCTCIAGYRGYGCTDSTHAYTSKSLTSVLFLTISNCMFIPAIILAIYRRLYIEALVYFFNMFFSTFYHACDQDINKFCIFKYDGLQLSDFIGSYASFVITLITMAIIPRSFKVFLFMLGLLTCIVINSRDRFDHLQFISLISITFIFTMLTWIIVSIRYRHLRPSSKRLLLVTPGFLLAIAGLVLFAFCETEENYWYIHSLWHILIATSILFFLPHKHFYKRGLIAQRNENVPEPVVNISTGSTTLATPIDNTSLSSSNTDTSKKSIDNLLN